MARRAGDIQFISCVVVPRSTVNSWDRIDSMRLRNGIVVDSPGAFDTAALRPA
jgi:hypothetical protein